MSDIVTKLRTPQEKLYGLMMLLFSIPLWVLIIFAVIGGMSSDDPKISEVVMLYLVYGGSIALFYFIAGLAYRASAFGNMILLSEKQFPELHAMVVEGAKTLGMSPTPKVFLYNSNGLFNAFARRILGGRYVFLTSALVEASSDEQVRFVIGHELGHHAAGHLNGWLNTLKLPGHMVPFLGSAYSRAREYTCDQIGAHLSNDTAVSQQALQMLGCGCRRLNEKMSCEAFMAQEEMVPPVFGFLTEIFRTHPRLTRRVRAIRNRQPVA
jgi:Zn-dependent protease with chaperone function